VLADWFQSSDLILSGGWVMVAILALSVVMWVLILDRYWCFYRTRSKLVTEAVEVWSRGSNSAPIVNRRLREALSASFNGKLSSYMITIHVITAVLPLLGLLGTVTGMIKTFEVMTAFGTGNVRGMADGISQALITTMAGLMTALAGMYFAGDLKQRIEGETERLREHLIRRDPESAVAEEEDAGQ
jgi:biopolymer transport protein ExbB